VNYVWLNVLADSDQSGPAQIMKLLQNPKEANADLGGGKAEAMMAKAYREFVTLPTGAHHAFMVSFSSSVSRSLSRRLLGICAAAGCHRLRAGGPFCTIMRMALRRSTCLSCQRSRSRLFIALSSFVTDDGTGYRLV
jgi:hypothetical protein